MKIFKPGTTMALVLLFLFSSTHQSCRKKEGQPPPPSSMDNTAPTASAGANVVVFLPVDSAILHGSATDAENNIDTYKWRQLTGPNQAIIETPAQLKTKVSQLIKGEYSFELSVLDKKGLMGKANVKVLVNSPKNAGTDTLNFNNLYAGCWGGECLLVIDGSSIPRNIPIKVYFKSEDSFTWIETLAYFFSNTDSGFRVQFGGNETHEAKKWEIMIVY